MSPFLKEYRQEVSRHLQFGSRTVSFNQKQGSASAAVDPRASGPPPTPEETQAKREKARKEIEKARKTLGEKALKTVDDAQRTQWTTLTGKPFQFRTNLYEQVCMAYGDVPYALMP